MFCRNSSLTTSAQSSQSHCTREVDTQAHTVHTGLGLEITEAGTFKIVNTNYD